MLRKNSKVNSLWMFYAGTSQLSYYDFIKKGFNFIQP